MMEIANNIYHIIIYNLILLYHHFKHIVIKTLCGILVPPYAAGVYITPYFTLNKVDNNDII